MEWKLHSVENYNEACSWMEKENDEIEQIAAGASGEKDCKRSQQLAVILLFTRQKVMEATQNWERKNVESQELRRECSRLQQTVKSLESEVQTLKSSQIYGGERRSTKRESVTQDTRTPSIPRKMSFRDTLSVSGRSRKG